MGVGSLWVQFVYFSSKLSNLLLKLGNPVGTGVLRGSKCILHMVEAGKNVVHNVSIGLIKDHGVKSVLGEGSIDAFAWSRGVSGEHGLLKALRARGTSIHGLLRGRGASARTFIGKDCHLGRGRSRARGRSRHRASSRKAKGGEVCLGYGVPRQGIEGVCENFDREDKEVNCSKRITI
jgi:hypothetical protein